MSIVELFVKNLPTLLPDELLMEFFQYYQPCDIILGKGLNRGSAVLKFTSTEHCDWVFHNLNKRVLFGKCLKVIIAREDDKEITSEVLLSQIYKKFVKDEKFKLELVNFIKTNTESNYFNKKRSIEDETEEEPKKFEQEFVQIDHYFKPKRLANLVTIKSPATKCNINNSCQQAQPVKSEIHQIDTTSYPPILHVLQTFASVEELEKNKLSKQQIVALPKFKNWNPGNPSTQIFVKNINKKKVKTSDLIFIFGRYSTRSDLSDVKINYMTKGRMNGQAFITFSNLEIAQLALEQVNGYILHDRPLILV